MGDYWGLVLALAIGVPLLVAAVLVDRRLRRRREEELAGAPERGDEAVDAHTPSYVTQDQVDAMPRPGGPGTRGPRPTGRRFSLAMAHPDFATTGDAAEYGDVRLLMVSDDVDTMRELLGPIATASHQAPLAIVATGFHGDVLGTLAANRRANQMPVVAVSGTSDEIAELCALVGGEVLSAADLRSGYVPDSALGHAAQWVSTPAATWVGNAPKP